jgi:hypothetical protein
MTISNIQKLHDLAETSLVSYANYTPSLSPSFEAAIQDPNKQIGAGLTSDQAKQFAEKYAFVHQKTLGSERWGQVFKYNIQLMQ